MVSLMEATADRSCLHSVQMILPKDETRAKVKAICNQNLRIGKVVDAYQQTLRDFEVALWELHDPSAWSIAQLKNPKRLSIRLDHYHTRFPGIERQFWESSPRSTVWNNLASTPEKTALGCLRSLYLERAGITDYQLATALKSNPMLTELRFRKCLTLTDRTFKFFAESNVGRHIETLCLIKSYRDELNDGLFEHTAKLTNLEV
ncbi:hypothetical protein HO133_004550 [Letharia lupina]|uniref:Uncharacterized protein n=1 Tax=Letharia lupina TaxID=560253 RepID=A0A8H6FKH4_9LECA|nr:uncharacterized protein HO133_004550 [Letharia lupina]KAF6230211.1 hypothetical protein HO133_004550 [Letharia lupina]